MLTLAWESSLTQLTIRQAFDIIREKRNVIK